MYNWRARIGYILPAQSVEALPRDFWKMAPSGVSCVWSFAGIREIDMSEVEAAIGRLQRAAEELHDHNVDVVHIGGLPMVTLKGPESEKPLVNQVRTWCPGKPVTTDFSAQMNAIRAFGANKVVLVSPNTAAVTESYRRSAEAVGIRVLHVECHDSPRRGIPLISHREIYHACAQAMHAAPQAELLWAPCGNYNILDLIEVLESDFGVPVVTANQTSFWWDFVLLHLNTSEITGFGRLFQTSVDSIAPAIKQILTPAT